MYDLSKTSLMLYSKYIEPNVFCALKAFLETDDITILEQSTIELACIIGNADLMKQLLSCDDKMRECAEKKLTHSFHNNLKLLVEKTWVEKSDETVKEQLLVRLDKICTKIENDKYYESYDEIISVLNDAVSLMFGETASQSEFAEYALRIDPDFGTFWCFLQSFPKDGEWNADKKRMSILLGMYFLANY